MIVPTAAPLLGVSLLIVAAAVCGIVRHHSRQRRGEALLRDTLLEREYWQLRQRGYLDITSPSIEQRLYRIPRHGRRVNVYEFGRAVCQLCLQPVEPLPPKDVVVLHKLLILGDEQGYLARANQLPVTSIQDTAFCAGRGEAESDWLGWIIQSQVSPTALSVRPWWMWQAARGHQAAGDPPHPQTP